MTDEDGQLLRIHRTVADKHDHLVRMYRTGWWRKTRQMITGRVINRADHLLDLIDGVGEFDENLRGDMEAEIERIRNDAMTPPSGKMTSRQEAIWDAAMDFFLDPVKLAERIIKDGAVRGLRTGVTQKQGFVIILRSYLNTLRREIEGMTEHEHRVWVKLHLISNEVISKYPRRHGCLHPSDDRCSWEHAKKIRARILLDMPNDRLVGNMKVSTIKEYFDQFCDECRELTAEEYERLRPREPPGEGATGLSPELKEAMLQQLEERIEQLDEPLRGVVQAWLQPDKGAEYRRRQRMEAGGFEQLLRLAKRELRGGLCPEELG
jgi:hypothetical protein